jgi:hypothetical protein
MRAMTENRAACAALGDRDYAAAACGHRASARLLRETIKQVDRQAGQPGQFLAIPSADFCIVCLWSALGLTLTGLLFALGFGAEIGEILAMAG